jgi:hypothetical protein
MTLKRETIAIAGAIVGVNLIGIATYAKPVRSFGCFQPLQQAAARFAPPAVERPDVPWGQPIGAAWDVRTDKTIPLYREGEAPKTPHVAKNGVWVEANDIQDTGRVQTPPQHRPLTTPYPPQSSTGTQTLPPPPGRLAPISHSILLGGESDASYQARRRAIAMQQGGN